MNATRVEIPKSLYKYYSPIGAERTIFDNTLKWTLPCDENDPFEAMPIGWDLTAVKQHVPDCKTEDVMSLDAIFDGNKVKEMISHITSFVSFAEEKDVSLMWAHYAEKHSGACLEFDTAILQDKIDYFKRVTYAKPDDERKRCPLPHDALGDNSPEYQKRVRDFLSYKANEWSYEKEWRWIVPPMVNIITCKKDGDKYILASDIPQGAVTKLIFGYNMPPSTRLVLAKQIRVKHPACRFAHAVLDPKLFKISVVDLDIDAMETSALGK